MMIRTMTILFLFILCVGCEDCSKPKREICAEESCRTVMQFNPAMKIMMPIRSCKCLKYEEARNECYFTKEKQNVEVGNKTR